MKQITQYIIFGLALTFFNSCTNEYNLNEEGDMLFLKHKGASMPVLVRGNFQSDIIILMVHGGAGGTSGVHIEDFNGWIEPEYMVAYWDQRHAGSSQGNMSKDDLTLDQFAEDMSLVIGMLKHKYGEDKKVFAVGHSWGVILTTYYLLTQENKLEGAILSNGSHSTEHEYSARIDYVHDFAQEMMDKGIDMPNQITAEGNTFSDLESVVEWTEQNDPIDSWEKLRTLNALVDAVFGYVQETYVRDTSDIPFPISSEEITYNSPYHPWVSSMNQLRIAQLINNPTRENSIQEFYDFTPMMDDIELPISLIWGKYDHIIGPEVAEDYYDVVGTAAEDKELIILEQSGHSGMYRENKKFSESLIQFVEKHR
ncbi:MAG: alpha/beta hydrolase [Bacteroidota bacterium]